MDFVTIVVEQNRLHKSLHIVFYVLETPSRLHDHPSIFIIGSTGNEYIITLSVNSISCSCPDTHNGCKHILFLLLSTAMITQQPHPEVQIHMSSLINECYSDLLHTHQLDPFTNYIVEVWKLHYKHREKR